MQSKHQRKADKANEEKTSCEDNDSGTVVKRDDQADLEQRRNQEEEEEEEEYRAVEQSYAATLLRNEHWE